MKSTQLLDARRNIRKEIVAFISIVMIGLLAALAYLGIAYSAAALKIDAVHFFNTQKLWDAEVTSTMLMTEEDLESILAIPEIAEAEPVWQIETRLNHGDGSTAVSVVSLPEKTSLPVMLEGRLPESTKECAVERNLAEECGLSVGQHIDLNPDKIMDIDPLVQSDFEITGIFHTPDHFSYMVPVTPYIYLQADSFNREGFDGAFMKTRVRAAAAPENRYSDAYRDVIAHITDALNALADERAPARDQGIRSGFEEQIREGEKQIESAREELRQAQQKIEDGRRDLAAAREQLDHMKQLIDYAELQLIQLEELGLDEWIVFFETLRENWYFSGEQYLDLVTQYEKGKKQLEEGERQLAEGEEKLRAAEEELREGKERLNGFDTCRWVVINNNANPGFIYAEANSDKLSSLSMSFSTIFLVVGALVIYATISRMVEQQRKLIGVNKALGLFNREIFAKYLIFACSAVLLGVGLGALLAWLPMQRAVLNSYEAHLNYGTGDRCFLPWNTGLVVAGALGISFVAVYLGCSQLLRQTALALMQGATPSSRKLKKSRSSAKRSLYVRLILRNMMTDWNRVLVTIVSIAGGCVLMVTGFTLRYGISGVPDRQFGGIQTYEAEVFYSVDGQTDTAARIEEILDSNALEHVGVRKEDTVFEMNGTLNALKLIVAEKGSMDGYFALEDAMSGEPLEPSDSGALIPRRFWETYSTGVGDEVVVFDSSMNHRSIRVSGVFENYYGQLFFMSPRGYEEVFGTPAQNNCFFVKTGSMSLNELQHKLDGIKGVVSVKDAAAERSVIAQFTSSLNFVVYLMLFIAGLMACFIVANFTMTFIQRKTGELTIMRINGFSTGECIRYLAADLVVTTVLGTAVGLVVGGFMGFHILKVTETAYIQMIREPRVESFLFSTLVTIFFSLVTNGFALRRISRLKLTDIS